ncbi:MAG: ABC-2 transporter permease [Tepidanaerobacter acetatoxydans]|jgi:ABC-2 type transport system permease protein|uniref:ABC-2 transporter permease n=1 Tax=Tepidanaerobacter TaxID=499228 RepID=UPI000AAFCCB6|nr:MULTISPECIES: ABC-2 transporter permease [Tepidanaerobacter]NLU09698.1 ABC-2 transporter permease [Tepidanaerobacter acetatoxydans]
MRHLVIKDLYVNRKYMSFVLLFLAAILVLKGSSAPMVLFGVGITSYGVLIRSCYYDDKDRGDIFLRTLPIKASTIVLSKYILGISVLFIVVAICLLFAILSGQNLDIYFASFAFSILAISIVYAIYLPIFFKYGYVKAATSQSVLFIIIMGASFGFKELINITNFPVPVNQLHRFLTPLINFINEISRSNIILLLTLSAVSLVILAVSAKLSIKFYDAGK